MARFAPLLAFALALSGCDRVQKLFAADDMSPLELAKMHVQKAQEAEARGDDDAAVREYEAARGTSLNDATIAAALGRLYAKRGDDAQATMSLKRAIELDPNNADLRKLLADVFLRQGDPKRAAGTLQAADADDVEAQVKLIRTLILTQKPDEALTLAEKLAGAHPENASALSAHAEALLANGKPDRAAELLDAAVKSAPDDVDVRLARARFLSRRGMHEQALQELERGNAAASVRSDVVFARAQELGYLGRYPEAGKILDVFATAHPNDPEAQSTLAWVKLQAGDTDAARTAAEAVLSKRAGDPQALYVRARCFEALEENTRAIAAYQGVLDVSPGHTASLQRLWRLYEKEGQVADAMLALETLYRTNDATDPERLEMVRLWSETRNNSRLGLQILDQVKSGSPEERATIRRKLQESASHDHGGGLGGGGPSIIRGGH